MNDVDYKQAFEDCMKVLEKIGSGEWNLPVAECIKPARDVYDKHKNKLNNEE